MDFTDNKKVSSDVGAFAAEFKRVCQSGVRTPDESRKLKAELDFKIMKHRADSKEQHMADLKEAFRRKLKGEIADE